MVRPPLSARPSVENPPPMGLDRIDYAIIAVYHIGLKACLHLEAFDDEAPEAVEVAILGQKP
jgi:hypothetical protein